MWASPRGGSGKLRTWGESSIVGGQPDTVTRLGSVTTRMLDDAMSHIHNRPGERAEGEEGGQKTETSFLLKRNVYAAWTR